MKVGAGARSPLLGFQIPYFMTGWKRRLLGGDPLFLTFFVTSACNAKCLHCLNVGRPIANRPPLTPAEVDRIARSMGPLFNLLISGGEPFLREDLDELIEPFHRHARVRQITVPTNGSLPERIETTTARLAGACPGAKVNVRLAVDGPAEVHDRIRGIPGGFELVMESARRIDGLRKRFPNVWLELCLTLSTLNQGSYADLLAELDRRGVPQTPFVLLCRPPTATADVWRVPRESYVRAHRAFRERALRASSGRPPLFQRIVLAYVTMTERRILRLLDEPDFRWRCSAGALSLVMDEVGTVYPCETSWEPVGDLRALGYDMRRVLRSDRLRAFREARRGGCRCTHETNITLDSSFTLRALVTALKLAVLARRPPAPGPR